MPSGYEKNKDEKDEAEALADELEQQYETIHVPKRSTDLRGDGDTGS